MLDKETPAPRAQQDPSNSPPATPSSDSSDFFELIDTGHSDKGQPGLTKTDRPKYATSQPRESKPDMRTASPAPQGSAGPSTVFIDDKMLDDLEKEEQALRRKVYQQLQASTAALKLRLQRMGGDETR